MTHAAMAALHTENSKEKERTYIMATKKKSSARRSARRSAARDSARLQVQAVILLAVAVLTFCIAIIQGENVWTWMHNLMLGLFSFSAYILPFLLGFVAVMLALEKDSSSAIVREYRWHSRKERSTMAEQKKHGPGGPPHGGHRLGLRSRRRRAHL